MKSVNPFVSAYQSFVCVCVLNKTKACPCCSIRCFDFLFFLKKVVHLSKLTLVKSERCLNCFHIFSLTFHRAATSSDDRQQLALFSCQFSLIIFTTAVARKSNTVPMACLMSWRLVMRHLRTNDVWCYWCPTCGMGAIFHLRATVEVNIISEYLHFCLMNYFSCSLKTNKKTLFCTISVYFTTDAEKRLEQWWVKLIVHIILQFTFSWIKHMSDLAVRLLK